MSNRYTIVQGIFPCHTCKEEVHSLRHYIAKKELTWMCSSKHISSVSLKTKKTREDHERKKREQANRS